MARAKQPCIIHLYITSLFTHILNKFQMIYRIYHPMGGSINHECKPATFMYTLVYKLQAGSLEEAYKMAQNDFNEHYASKGHRSTCVGDVIMSDEDYENNVCHLVKGAGFQEVSDRWVSYIDWGMVDKLIPDAATLADQQEEMKNLH